MTCSDEAEGPSDEERRAYIAELEELATLAEEVVQKLRRCIKLEREDFGLYLDDLLC